MIFALCYRAAKRFGKLHHLREDERVSLPTIAAKESGEALRLGESLVLL
ncbi:hypothetical protein ACTGJ9_038490 [Bradyrhizobium sp. RDM12]